MFSLPFLTPPLAFSFFFSPSSIFNLFNNPHSSSASPNPSYATIQTTLLQIFIVISSVGFLTMHYLHRKRNVKDKKAVPVMHITSSGSIDKLERFSQYVGRQLGLEENSEGLLIGKLAEGYLRKSKDHEDNIYDYLNSIDADETVYIKLIEEFDRCILGYFAFHWSHASVMITQVLSSVESEPKRKLKNMVMAATRKQRFERVTKDLKVTRLFSTLVEEMKAIKSLSNDESDETTKVMVPAAHSQRSPVLLFMGGGMGAGKSTVLKDILKESFWADAAANAVVVEADAFKETDVIYKALSSRGHHDMLHTAELVHQSSTDAASSLLVTALNEGRDVIMDGTLSWEPFVEQTVAMARNVHHHRYRMGVGYKVATDGTITENYWEQVEHERHTKRKPYRIELVGVVCDPYLAVVRGIRRAILMGRAVRVKSQLTSHKRFANAFPRYCQLVDNARLYCTNGMGGPPLLIGWKDGANNILVDPDGFSCLKTVSVLNEEADSIEDVYRHEDSPRQVGSVWKDIVLSPARVHIQEELKNIIQKAEDQLATNL